MQKRWAGKAVDLLSLSKSIEEFLQRAEFKVHRIEEGDEFEIVGYQNFHTRRLNAIVKVSGTRDDFSIDFLGSEKARSSVLLGLLTTMIGGGSLVIKGLKAQEALEKLENEFWAFIEEVIASTTDRDACIP